MSRSNRTQHKTVVGVAKLRELEAEWVGDREFYRKANNQQSRMIVDTYDKCLKDLRKLLPPVQGRIELNHTLVKFVPAKPGTQPHNVAHFELLQNKVTRVLNNGHREETTFTAYIMEKWESVGTVKRIA